MLVIEEFDIIESEDRNDDYFTIIKNDKTNIALAISNNASGWVELRLKEEDNEKILQDISAEKIGTCSVMIWDIIQCFHELDCYNIQVAVGDNKYSLDVQCSAYTCNIPILIISQDWIEEISINKKKKKAVITFDTEALEYFLKKVSNETKDRLN